MKQRKGFTLIELLAVIVILAIIALIAVPQILGVIEKSRKGAAESSAYGYIDAVEKYMIMHDIDSSKYEYDLRNKTLNVEKETTITIGTESITIKALNTIIEVKGSKPTSGTVIIDNKEVTSATLVVNGYNVTCTGKSCSASGKTNDNISNNNNNSDSTPSATPEPTPIVETYTVHYDANGGSNAPANTTHNVGENSSLSNSEPTRSGYSFLGWSTNSSATSATYQKGATIKDLTTQGNTITLYAVWTRYFNDVAKIGDYVYMVPTKEIYTLNIDDGSGTVYPNELKRWIVINKKENGQVELVSESVSSTDITITHNNTYADAVYLLNNVANQYINEQYTESSARCIGYSNQTLQCSSYTSCPTDTGHLLDVDSPNGLVYSAMNIARGTSTEPLLAYRVDTSTGMPSSTVASYWLASRVYQNSNCASMRIVDTDGSITNIYVFNGCTTYDPPRNRAIRPIITIKQNVKILNGTGTSENPWILLN